MAWDSAIPLKKNDAGDPGPIVWDEATQDYYIILGKLQTGLDLAIPFQIPTDMTGVQLFSEENPGAIKLTGSNAANYESVTVANSAIGLTAGTYGANVYALITCETAQIRFRIDGTNPTASEGHILNPGDILRLNSNADIAAFKAIRTGSVSGVIKATYSGVA